MHKEDDAGRFHGIAAAFYPEHMDPSLWEPNIRQMAGMGIRAVRIGEFWWDRLEPEHERYDLAFVREILDLLHAHEIQVILCTPSAAPPVWMCEDFPQILPVDANGNVMGFGIRRHTCPTSETYRQLCAATARQLGAAFGNHPALLAWHIDNELGHPTCYCERCADAFHEYLAETYDDVERLNESLGLAFWAQSVSSFDQVPLPRNGYNPGLLLAWRRFMSRQWIDYHRNQYEALRETGCRQPITTNMMAPWNGYDHVKMGRFCDIVGYDYYPRSHPFGFTLETMAFFVAMHRSYGKEDAVWLFETQEGSKRDELILPGQVRYWTMAHVALGVTLVEYFRWDMPVAGAERLNQGIVHAHGQPYRAFREITQTAGELSRLREALDATVRPAADIGILCSFDSWWNEVAHPTLPASAIGAEGMMREISYCHHHLLHFRALMQLGHLAELTDPEADWHRYKALILPTLTCLSGELVARLQAYVAQGGVILAVGMPGAVDENGRAGDRPPPGLLSDLLGVRIEDWGTQPGELAEIMLQPTDAAPGLPLIRCGDWLELAVSEGAETLAVCNQDLLAAWTMLSRKRVGEGTAYYLGTIPMGGHLRDFYTWLLLEIGLAVNEEATAGIYHVKRRGKDGAPGITFTFNTLADHVRIFISERVVDLLNGGELHGEVCLPPYGILATRGPSDA